MTISNKAMYSQSFFINIVMGRTSPSYVINGESIVVVDVPFPSDAKAILKFVHDVLQRNIKEIKLVVLTHSHIDHANGVDYLVEMTGAEVAAHVNSKDYLTGKSAIPIPSFPYILEFLYFLWSQGLPLPSLSDIFSMPWVGIPGIRKALKSKVTYWLIDGQELPYSPEWQVIHSPGHTSDSICLYNSIEKILVSGDTIINNKGVLKLNQLLVLDKVALKESFKKLQRLPVDYICPGWGLPVIGDDILKDVH
jgi:hydroxyacylglutathione hydrolase